MIRVFVFLCLAIQSCSALATSKVEYVSDNGFAVSNQFTSEHTANQIWLALIEDVDSWWPKDHRWWGAEGRLRIDAVAGGCFCEVAGQRSAEHMRISFVEPDKLLRMIGGLGPLQGLGMQGALDWQIKKEQSQTQVILTYRVSGINPDGFEQLAKIVAQVQGVQLSALENYLNQSLSK